MRKLPMILAVLALFALAVPAMAQDGSYPTNSITVTGFGSAAGSPDIANLEIGVERANTDVSVAFNEVNTTIDDVIAAIVEAGVAREDVRTTGVNIFQDFYGPMGPAESGSNGEPQFRVSNQVRVTIRDIDAVADVISASVGAGATQIFGLNFGIDDRDNLEAEARVEAMEDARTRAEAIAELIGAELGDVIIVVQGGGGFPGPSPFDVMNESLAMGGGGVPIEPGQLSVTTTIQVTFAINR